MQSVRIPARLGLLGNPSDGFAGRVIATTIDDFAATVTTEPSERWELTSPTNTWTGASTSDVAATLDASMPHGLELLAAAIVRLDQAGAAPAPHRVQFSSTIPRQCGLAGSSAIVVATLRSLAPQLAPVDVARLALEAEVEVLGWAAGPQDRVVQAMGGLVDMRFDEAWDPTRYVRLDPHLLPPLVLAWTDVAGTHSGDVHAPVRERWDAGEADVVDALARFASLAEEGRAALDDGSAAEQWPELATEAFSLRQALWSVADTDIAMVEAIRAAGGGASLAGSGGAVVGYLPDPAMIHDATQRLTTIGAHAIVPTIGRSS